MNSVCLYFIGNPVFGKLSFAEQGVIKWIDPYDRIHIYMLPYVPQQLTFAHFWLS